MEAKIAATAEKVAKLEVSLRMRELKILLYDHALSMIEAKMIERRILYEMPESEATNDDYANLIVFNHVGKLTEPQASKFGFITTVLTDGMNNIVIDDGSELTTGPPAERKNNNAHLGPRKFTLDFIETKTIDLQKLVNKFLKVDFLRLDEVNCELAKSKVGIVVFASRVRICC